MDRPPPDTDDDDLDQPLVEVIDEDGRWHAFGLPALAERAAAATLAHLGLDPAAFLISLMGCDDVRIAGLNAEFRGKPKATNVLSWPAEDRAPEAEGDAPDLPEGDPDDPEELGDIAIAWETCVAEAEAGAKPLADHVTHLIVHATLHLLGYDHEREGDAERMESTEIAILGTLGLANPYA